MRFRGGEPSACFFGGGASLLEFPFAHDFSFEQYPHIQEFPFGLGELRSKLVNLGLGPVDFRVGWPAFDFLEFASEGCNARFGALDGQLGCARAELDQGSTLYDFIFFLDDDLLDGAGDFNAQIAGTGRLDAARGDVDLNDLPLLDTGRLDFFGGRGEPVPCEAGDGDSDDPQKPAQTVAHSIR